MIRLLPLVALVLAFAPAPVPAPVRAQGAPPQLTLEQQTALRCSAAFAIVTTLQERGGASEFPALGNRAREYFVQSSARIMDDTGIDREGLTAIMQAEAARLTQAPDALSQVMPACLALLDASGL